MDNAVRGEGSNSPSAKLLITSITRRGTKREQYEVALSDGSSFFVPPSVWVEVHRNAGEAVDVEWRDEVQRRAVAYDVRRRALNALAMREHSRFQLARKLSRFGFPSEAVDRELDRLEAEGLQDDQRFANAWIRSRLKRHPEGAAALLGGLLKAGIPRRDAEAALEQLGGMRDDEPDPLDNALSDAVEKITRSREVDRESLMRKLAARGFSYNRISRYFRGRENSENGG